MDVIEYTNKIRALTSSINESCKTVEDNIEESKRKILVAYTRDSRSAKHWNATVETLNKLVWAGLKSIPGLGGYFSLLYKVMKDPLKGTYEISRTSYGDYWDPPGANSVMSPLLARDDNFNYATGRLRAFNSDPRLRAEQFEADVFDMVPGVFGDGPRGQGMQNQGRINIQRQGKTGAVDAGKKLAVSEWRQVTMNAVAQFPTEAWMWYSMAQMVSTMMNNHEGLDDLGNGVFNKGSDNAPVLVHKGTIQSVGKSLKMSSRHSNLHGVLAHYEPPRYLEHLFWKKDCPYLDKKTIYRVASAKAIVVAYQGEVRKTLAEIVSDHLFKIINDAANQSTKIRRILDRGDSLVGIVLLSPLRIVGALAPKKIYNYKTTFESKQWARFLCAIEVFYRILTAYLDEPFACNFPPSKRSLHFFLLAYTDAYNTAVEYFYHETAFNSTRNHAGEDIEMTLQNLLQIDPAIHVYLASLCDEEFENLFTLSKTMYNHQPPGLKGFKHVKSSTISLGRIAGHSYSRKHSITLAKTKEWISTIQRDRLERYEEYKKRYGSDFRGKVDGIKGESVSLQVSMDVSRKNIIDLADKYKQTFSNAMQDLHLPESMREHTIATHHLMMKILEVLAQKRNL